MGKKKRQSLFPKLYNPMGFMMYTYQIKCMMVIMSAININRNIFPKLEMYCFMYRV